MIVYDLNRDQLEKLKQRYMMEAMDEQGEMPSLEDLANADAIISDEEIYNEYAGTIFSPDDFSSSEEETIISSRTGELEDKLLALEIRVRAIEEDGYIPFVSPYPSSTEKQLADAVRRAAVLLNQAAYCAHQLRY